jgi:hypothetical protein
MARAGSTQATPRRFIPVAVAVLLWLPRRILSTGDDEATVDRMFASRHVADLRLIIAGALLGALLALVIGLPLAAFQQAVTDWSDVRPYMEGTRSGDWFWVRFWISVAVSFFTFFAPLLALVGGVIAWAYQVGSARLGVVDLFACEISTLCRVLAALDSVRARVEAFGQGPAASSVLIPAPGLVQSLDPVTIRPPAEPTQPFTSQEDYFPVFTANNHDLQTLEASTVITITEFYTYMKAARDGMRALADVAPDADDLAPPPPQGPAPGPWRGGQRNILYMLFLGMEAARHAIGHLVEFEPEKAERTIVGLLSELEAYRFLCFQYTDPKDVHRRRIVLREDDYRHVVPGLRRAVEAERRAEVIPDEPTPWDTPRPASKWEPACRLLDELEERYKAALEATAATS